MNHSSQSHLSHLTDNSDIAQKEKLDFMVISQNIFILIYISYIIYVYENGRTDVC